MAVNPIPEGYHSITPYLIVDDAEAAIDFYKRAFGAEEVFRMPMGGKIGHAEVRIGDSVVMLADEFPEMGHLGPRSRGGPTAATSTSRKATPAPGLATRNTPDSRYSSQTPTPLHFTIRSASRARFRASSTSSSVCAG